MLPLSMRACVITIALSRATTALAQAPIDISQEVLMTLNIPNAAGDYGKSILTDRNVNGLVVGGFTFPEPTSPPEGSFFLTLTPVGLQAKLFTCGPEVTWTQVRAVNRHGAMVGWCYTRTEGGETVHGFYRSESGKVTPLRVPGARLTEAMDLNDTHVVVGEYIDMQGGTRGFRWTRGTGQFETLDAPLPGTWATIPTGINTAGHIIFTVFTPTNSVGALLKQGQWTTIAVPGATSTTLEDLTDQGAILGWVTTLGGYQGNFLREQGIDAAVTLPLAHASNTAALALSPQHLTVGYYFVEIPPPHPDAPWISTSQGFIAPLPAVLGDPLTPPAPQMAARLRTVAASQAAPTMAVQHDGCPDEPVPAGMRRVGKLALSWVGCARLRGK